MLELIWSIELIIVVTVRAGMCGKALINNISMAMIKASTGFDSDSAAKKVITDNY